ncbi:hypothetical protein ACVXZ4_16560 [Lacisediminihabitans sp. FW035]
MTDTSTGGGFDPRFNPAFQPGYDPSVHARPPVVPDRAPAPELIEHPLSPESTPAIPAATPTAGVAGDPAESATPRRFDPYLASLWALSVVFVAAGLLVLRYIADRMDRLSATGSAFDYNLVLVYTIAAPLLVVLGLATATGTLFLLAARRR